MVSFVPRQVDKSIDIARAHWEGQQVAMVPCDLRIRHRWRGICR